MSHDHKGNCWDAAIVYGACKACRDDMCDVCHLHDEPRGGCSKCVPCLLCIQDEDAGL